MRAQLIEAEDGAQIVVFPAGFTIDAAEVEIRRDGDSLLLLPVSAEVAESDGQDG